jgi:hypothetical protein
VNQAQEDFVPAIYSLEEKPRDCTSRPRII